MNSLLKGDLFNGVMLASVVQADGKRIVPNDEFNRTKLAETFLAAGCSQMTPVMCGFLLMAMALPINSDEYAKVKVVSHKMYYDFEEAGMPIEYAMAAAMRIKAETPDFFNSLAKE
jgi:hypothetical protein